ncbi:MAG: restriction endonuclease subunit S, partial [Proteobacteria bacterium]|nr:restriction endonuclease subunit S [Pseudomonadota bacterium]
MPRTKKTTTASNSPKTIPTVPAAEQPYQVPENWRWVRLGDIIKLISGRDASLSECNDIGIGIPYILGASNIENNKFMIERWIEKPIVVSNKGDILLSVKGTIGKLYIQTENEINISRQIMAIHPYDMRNTRYVYYFLSSICDKLKEAGNGLIPGVSRKDILDSIFPLPPLAEQQRIVDRIERLFAKLNEAREKAQAVVDGFENRKAAILHQAFTGELTKKWREERGIGMDSWKLIKLYTIANAIDPQPSHRT